MESIGDFFTHVYARASTNLQMENRLQTKPRMAGLSDPIVNDVPHRDDDRNLALVLPSCLRSFMLVEMSGYASNRLQTNSGLCTQFEHQ